MQCPACQRRLRQFKIGSVDLDACEGGCGGIWFDYDELVKVDGEHADPRQTIATPKYDPAVAVDDYAVRNCPRCAGVTLDKKLFSLGSGVILDRCLECRGVWLDRGELEKIRDSLHPRPFKPRAVPRKPRLVIPVTFAVIGQVRTLHLGPAPEKPRPGRRTPGHDDIEKNLRGG